MPFDTCTFREAKAWAKRMYGITPKCDRCGDILPEKHYYDPDEPDIKFCSEYCAEKSMIANMV